MRTFYYNFIIIVLIVLFCFPILAQRETIAIKTRFLDDNYKEKQDPIISITESFFNNLMLESGYDVVERKSLDELFENYNDQTREDYLNGKTIRAKLKGAKDYLFIDIVENSDETYLISICITDVFQKTISLETCVLVNSINFNKNLFEKKAELSKVFNDQGFQLFYFSYDTKKNIKLVNESRFRLSKNTKIYGFQKDNQNQPIITLEFEESASSNMIVTSINNYDKKVIRKISEYDFSSLVFTTQSKLKENKKSNSISLNLLNCLRPAVYFQLVKSISEKSNFIVNDLLHNNILDFEKMIQSNELFLEGKSYFKDEKIPDVNYRFDCNSKQLIYNSNLYINNKLNKTVNYNTTDDLINDINNFK